MALVFLGTEAAPLKRRPTKANKRPESFAAALEERTGLRQVGFAVPARDYPSIDQAKRRFGTVAVARLLARLCREVLRLCRGAVHR